MNYLDANGLTEIEGHPYFAYKEIDFLLMVQGYHQQVLRMMMIADLIDEEISQNDLNITRLRN